MITRALQSWAASRVAETAGIIDKRAESRWRNGACSVWLNDPFERVVLVVRGAIGESRRMANCGSRTPLSAVVVCSVEWQPSSR